ncbi:MAG TPA: ATP-binding cassette domain-containing protein [Streptosporangiaceae bacterium]|nr:ATP-binding cassette domain-containing protein [Streptosporangiaceae bacterium]
MIAIEAEGLRKSFGKVEALRGVDLAVPCGTICALLGPNGAGKTTAVRVLATLAKPDGGTARVSGHDVLREPRRVRADIGLAGQHAAVDDDLTGVENLFILGLMWHLGRRRARARARELLQRFGLADAGNRLVKTWSGGMRRRLDLIASLVVEPAVLFLDEPTTGVDPRSRSEIWSAVRLLAAGGTTVLLTTQYLDEADRLAGQIVIIDAGLVTLQGTPDELKNALGNRVDVVLDDAGGSGEALSAAQAVLRGMTGSEPEVDRDARRLTAPVTAGAVTLTELVRRLDAAGVEAQDVRLRRPTLDEVFLAGTATEAEPAA